MKSRKLKNTLFLNLVLVVLIFWTQLIISFKPDSASGFEAMMIAWVGSFLLNNGFYFFANVSQKIFLAKYQKREEKQDESE